jgi:hypothetical protein
MGWFIGLQWWELALVLMPLVVGIGGLIGGLVGVLGMASNLWVARRSLPTEARIAVMIGVLVASVVVWFLVAATVDLLPYPA